MQDRFRFRVWNKLFNTMTYNFMFGNFMQKSLEDYEKKDWVGLNYEPDYICYNNKAIEDNLVIMQSTGLKDKNGKLIYEGDIVKAYFTDDDILKYDLMIVEWCRNSCAFVFKDYKFMNFEDFITTCFESESYEVVGNIYEDKIEQM